jgi:hypothetical protein
MDEHFTFLRIVRIACLALAVVAAGALFKFGWNLF